MISAGRIRAVLLGRRILIPMRKLERCLANLPVKQPQRLADGREVRLGDRNARYRAARRPWWRRLTG